MAGCPHRNIVHCPLYHAGHDAQLRSHTCMHGDIEYGCSVARGEDEYSSLLGLLSVTAPRLAAMLKFKETATEAREQTQRNLKLNGIH